MPCYVEKTKDGGVMFLCGDFGPRCADEKCGASTDYLCDYPVGDNKTCDRPMCGTHANEVAPELHYCAAHLRMWQDYRIGVEYMGDRDGRR